MMCNIVGGFLAILILSLSYLQIVAKGTLLTLDEETWSEMLTGEWMVEFFAPWCPACKSLETEWKNFAGWSDDLNIKVAAVDVTANPGLSGRFMVTALPTIYHVKEGVFRQYKGARDTNSFVSFIEEKKWVPIEPLSKWKAPDSIQMSIVSQFFKISMALRAVHNRLVEDYGVPYWGSYMLFAFATILLGALLGLLIVCVIDLIFPAKAIPDTHRHDVARSSSPDENSDLIDDIHEDSKDKTENREVRRRKYAKDTQEEQTKKEESESEEEEEDSENDEKRA